MTGRAVSYEAAMDLIRNLGPALAGNYSGRYARIYHLFWSTFCREVFVEMRTSYLTRAVGSADTEGDTWHPLKPSTVKRKSKAGRRGGRYLPPAKHPEWINIDSEDLLTSYSPGMIVGDQYVPTPQQLAQRVQGGLKLGSNVPYAKQVDQLRKLFPRSYLPWVQRALKKAAQAIIPLIENP